MSNVAFEYGIKLAVSNAWIQQHASNVTNPQSVLRTSYNLGSHYTPQMGGTAPMAGSHFDKKMLMTRAVDQSPAAQQMGTINPEQYMAHRAAREFGRGNLAAEPYKQIQTSYLDRLLGK